MSESDTANSPMKGRCTDSYRIHYIRICILANFVILILWSLRTQVFKSKIEKITVEKIELFWLRIKKCFRFVFWLTWRTLNLQEKPPTFHKEHPAFEKMKNKKLLWLSGVQLNQDPVRIRIQNTKEQCCGSVSVIQWFFDPLIGDPEWEIFKKSWSGKKILDQISESKRVAQKKNLPASFIHINLRIFVLGSSRIFLQSWRGGFLNPPPND